MAVRAVRWKNEGYEVERAYNGKEAITKLNTNPDIYAQVIDDVAGQRILQI